MAKYKVVSYFTSVVAYRQVDYVEAKSEQEAEEKVYEMDLRFTDPICEDVEALEISEVIEVTE